MHRAYPNQIVHLLDGDGEVAAPRALHPVFWGCFDWHSAVHGHWTLVAFARRFADDPRAGAARAALATSFTADAIAGEARYLAARPSFERPYGLAWLCALHAELAAWSVEVAGGAEAAGGGDAATWAAGFAPLAEQAATRIASWLERLGHPTRVGTHAQSAFGAGLALDWARAVGADAIAARIAAAAWRLHRDDRGPALHLEPSGEDFLSPALGAAEMVARIVDGDALASWLDRALPDLADPRDAMPPPIPCDRSDGRLVHLDGLCASRAWMMKRIADALPDGDRRREILDERAAEHAAAALRALANQGYEGAHWLGTFALYMRTIL